MQIVDPIPADLIYGEADTYTTGFQQPRHLEDLITTTVARQDPGRAIDIGCNDGSLLEALRRAGYAKVVGIEPNPMAAAIAREKGHQVYTSYLSKDLATQIIADCGEFDTVYLRHVVEHVSDLGAFFEAVRMLLRPDGLLVLELPDVEEGFALGSPAILWEEHVSYFTHALAEYMLERFGFHVSDRRRYVFGGGSIAFVAQKKAVPVSCTIRRPDPSATLALLRGFVSGMERQKDELSECRFAGEVERLQGPHLRGGAAVLPAGLGRPNRRHDRLRGGRSPGHTASAYAGDRSFRRHVGRRHPAGWKQDALPVGRGSRE